MRCLRLTDLYVEPPVGMRPGGNRAVCESEYGYRAVWCLLSSLLQPRRGVRRRPALPASECAQLLTTLSGGARGPRGNDRAGTRADAGRHACSMLHARADRADRGDAEQQARGSGRTDG